MVVPDMPAVLLSIHSAGIIGVCLFLLLTGTVGTAALICLLKACGYRLVPVTSDLMEPAIKKNSVLLSVKCGPENLSDGDVVTFTNNGEEKAGRVTSVNMADRTVKINYDSVFTGTPVTVYAENITGRTEYAMPVIGPAVRTIVKISDWIKRRIDGLF